MREDDGVELFFERKDFAGERLRLRGRHAFAKFQARQNFCDISHGKKLLSHDESVNEWLGAIGNIQMTNKLSKIGRAGSPLLAESVG
jgi:hypothetical protein